MNKKSSIYVEVEVPTEDTQAAMVVIDKFLEKNNIKTNLTIAYNYEMPELGLYKPFEEGNQRKIFVNPLQCKNQDQITFQDSNEPFAPGYCADISLFGIIIHEFCHFLQYKVYKNIIKKYKDEFPTKRLHLNNYSNNEIRDEIAEIMTLYILNPYLLRLISKQHFNFCKKYFKSVITCSINRCANIYNGWPHRVKEHLKNFWGITYNISTKKFVRIDNGKTKEDSKKSSNKSSV